MEFYIKATLETLLLSPSYSIDSLILRHRSLAPFLRLLLFSLFYVLLPFILSVILSQPSSLPPSFLLCWPVSLLLTLPLSSLAEIMRVYQGAVR